MGVPIIITQTLRTTQEQDDLYALGRTKPGKIVTYARGGFSYHNYGLAFDFALLLNGKPSWDDIGGFGKIGLLGESLGLEWGGRWKRVDLPHFQETFGLSLYDLRSGKRPA